MSAYQTNRNNNFGLDWIICSTDLTIIHCTTSRIKYMFYLLFLCKNHRFNVGIHIRHLHRCGLKLAGWNPNRCSSRPLFYCTRKLLDCLFWQMARPTQPKSSINYQGGSIHIFTLKKFIIPGKLSHEKKKNNENICVINYLQTG